MSPNHPCVKAMFPMMELSGGCKNFKSQGLRSMEIVNLSLLFLSFDFWLMR